MQNNKQLNKALVNTCSKILSYQYDDNYTIVPPKVMQNLEDIMSKLKAKKKAPEPLKIIGIFWSYDDIKNIRPDLNNAQISEVLRIIKCKHNLGFNITRETVEVICEEYSPD